MLIIGKKTAKIILLFFAVLFLFAFGDSKAANLGNQSIFKVDPVFDVNERNQVTAELVANSGNLYFYVEKDWWNLQVPAKKTEILGNLEKVSFLQKPACFAAGIKIAEQRCHPQAPARLAPIARVLSRSRRV